MSLARATTWHGDAQRRGERNEMGTVKKQVESDSWEVRSKGWARTESNSGEVGQTSAKSWETESRGGRQKKVFLFDAMFAGNAPLRQSASRAQELK